LSLAALETAATRSRAITAKRLGDNPTLVRLRELEILEKIAASSQGPDGSGDECVVTRSPEGRAQCL
jgi:hypothetical protein